MMVGIDAYHITGENGDRSGYGYEYEQAVAAYTGWTYEYVEGGWSELLEKLKKCFCRRCSGIHGCWDERSLIQTNCDGGTYQSDCEKSRKIR